MDNLVAARREKAIAEWKIPFDIVRPLGERIHSSVHSVRTIVLRMLPARIFLKYCASQCHSGRYVTTMLSPSMTLNEFDQGYWYAAELKSFATALGVRHGSKLRKDELEASIRGFLVSGKVLQPRRRVRPAASVKDVEREIGRAHV